MPATRCLLALSLSLTAVFAVSSAQDQSCTPGLLDSSAPLSQIFQKACHNCYEKKYAKTFQSVFNSVEAVEIDFYDTKDLVSGAKSFSWYVRHGPGTLFQSGNDNNCTGDGTGKNDLEACLKDVKAASDAHPSHSLYVVYLDKKQAWGPTRQPVDLDNHIKKIFSTTKIFRPRDLKQNHDSLRAAAQAGAWPSYSSLNGKVMFVLTGGQSSNHNKTQSQYVADRGSAAVIFVAPDTDETSDITGVPNQFNTDTAKWVVVYNIKEGDQKVAPTAHAKNYLSRLWNGKEDSTSYTSNLKKCVNFIALYDYKETKFNGGVMDGTFR
jgi:calcium-dependent phosphoinositide phospholipase C